MKNKYVDQRTSFVESLSKSIRKEAEQAKRERNIIASSVTEYLSSGLTEAECIELLIVEGIGRETAEGYLAMAQDERGFSSDSEHEYSFVFEDSYGNVYSSYDINRTIVASSDLEAWDQANGLTGDDTHYEIDNIVSVDRIA